jgi:hypothetical protein
MENMAATSCCRPRHGYVSASGSNPPIDSASELAKLLLSQGHHSRDATNSVLPQLVLTRSVFDGMFDRQESV